MDSIEVKPRYHDPDARKEVDNSPTNSLQPQIQSQISTNGLFIPPSLPNGFRN